MTNAVRGEMSIDLAGVEYTLRPSFTAIQAIEVKTGQSLAALAGQLQSMQATLETMGIVGRELIVAGAEEGSSARGIKSERVAQLIFADGSPKASIRLSIALIAALTGGVDTEGNAKAAETNGTTSAA